jgi:hypothetical protein
VTGPYDNPPPEPVTVRLTEEEMKHVERVVKNRRASINEHTTRLAQPHERDNVAERIDPATAVVFFEYAEMSDPYGEHRVPNEESCIGRQFFAVDPRDGVAVWIEDLTKENRDQLADKVKQANAEGWRQLFEHAPEPEAPLEDEPE